MAEVAEGVVAAVGARRRRRLRRVGRRPHLHEHRAPYRREQPAVGRRRHQRHGRASGRRQHGCHSAGRAPTRATGPPPTAPAAGTPAARRLAVRRPAAATLRADDAPPCTATVSPAPAASASRAAPVDARHRRRVRAQQLPAPAARRDRDVRAGRGAISAPPWRSSVAAIDAEKVAGSRSDMRRTAAASARCGEERDAKNCAASARWRVRSTPPGKRARNARYSAWWRASHRAAGLLARAAARAPRAGAARRSARRGAVRHWPGARSTASITRKPKSGSSHYDPNSTTSVSGANTRPRKSTATKARRG